MNSSTKPLTKPLICVLLFALPAMLACTSMPFVPKDGFSLATADYVAAEDAELRAEVISRIESGLPDQIEAALIEDRKRISLMQDWMLQQETQIDQLTVGVSNMQQDVASTSRELRHEAENLRATSEEVEAAIASLPTEALRIIAEALNRYLQEVPPLDASDAIAEPPGMIEMIPVESDGAAE